MPAEPDKWLRAVVKLTDLTQQGELDWEIADYQSGPSVVGPSYFAEYKDRLLRLEKIQIESSDSWHGRGETVEEITLDFVDRVEKTSLWTFPSSTGLDQLYGAVRYRTAGVSDFLDSLLDDD